LAQGVRPSRSHATTRQSSQTRLASAMVHETAADIETTGLLSMEENQGKSPPSRTLRVAVLTAAMITTLAFILRWQQPQSNPAAIGSSIVAASLPYDCDAGRWNAQNGWSEEKKAWCCTNQQKGCPGDTVDTGAGAGGVPVPPQTQPAPGQNDCDEGRWNAQKGWSEEKKAWCCTNQQKGCAGDTVDTGAGASGVPVPPQIQPAPGQYDCDAGRWNAQNGWAEGKKAWCCTNQQKGCPGDTVDTGAR